MTKTGKTILLVVVGLVVCFAIVAAGGVVWFLTSALETTAADKGTATQSFADIRARFEGNDPILKMTAGGPLLTRQPPSTSAPHPVKAVRLVAWDPDEQKLSTVTLPFWMLRFTDGPINVSAESSVPDVRLSMTVEELERYGPAVWIDHEDLDGSRVLIWSE